MNWVQLAVWVLLVLITVGNLRWHHQLTQHQQVLDALTRHLAKYASLLRDEDER